MLVRRKLFHAGRPADLKATLEMVISASESLTASPEHVHLDHQYYEQLSDLKTELGSIRQAIIAAGVDSSDDLFSTLSLSQLDKGMFDAMLNIKKLLYPKKDMHH